MHKHILLCIGLCLLLNLTPVLSQSTGNPLLEPAALYHWANYQSGDHILTTDPTGETAPGRGYISKGVIGYVAFTQLPGTTALYRWVKPENGDHIYTTDPNGENAPVQKYKSEGITGYVAKTQLPGTTALYRWVNHPSGYHFYTTDPNDKAMPGIGYTSEGIKGYIWTKDYAPEFKTTALYLWVSPGRHFYTTDPTGEAESGLGYTAKGITGYVARTQLSGTTALYRWVNHQSGDYFYTTNPKGEICAYCWIYLRGHNRICGLNSIAWNDGALSLG